MRFVRLQSVSMTRLYRQSQSDCDEYRDGPLQNLSSNIKYKKTYLQPWKKIHTSL